MVDHYVQRVYTVQVLIHRGFVLIECDSLSICFSTNDAA